MDINQGSAQADKDITETVQTAPDGEVYEISERLIEKFLEAYKELAE